MVAGLRADDDQKQEQQQPEEIPNFSQLDEYIYVPKSTLSLGTRFFLKGPKASYSGQGSVPSAVNPGADNTVGIPNISRTYIDGAVYPDDRQSTVSNGVGNSTNVNVPPDGRTNNWTYTNNSQLLPNGDLAFHIFSGVVTDTSDHLAPGVPTEGLELILDRDMGKIGKHMTWSITAGFSIADIHSSTFASVPTNVTTLTDTYDLFGQVPPPAPFTSPGTVNQTVVNSNGQPATNGNTPTEAQTVTQTILLGNAPLNRSYTVLATDTLNRYFVEGAYYTFRVGPTLLIPMGQHFKFSISAGPDLIYAGSEYNVLEELTTATGESFTQLYQQQGSRVIPGYYVDVNLRYEVTETAGFYVGGLFQGAGGFTQSLPSGTSASGAALDYKTRLDFGDEQGVKAGMTVRF